MEKQYSLLIDTSITEDDPDLCKKIYELLLPTDVSKTSITREYFNNNAVKRQVGDKQVYFRFIQNFINNTRSIEIFLNDIIYDTRIIDAIKSALAPIKEIKSYRIMTVTTKTKIEIESI